MKPAAPVTKDALHRAASFAGAARCTGCGNTSGTRQRENERCSMVKYGFEFLDDLVRQLMCSRSMNQRYDCL